MLLFVALFTTGNCTVFFIKNVQIIYIKHVNNSLEIGINRLDRKFYSVSNQIDFFYLLKIIGGVAQHGEFASAAVKEISMNFVIVTRSS